MIVSKIIINIYDTSSVKIYIILKLIFIMCTIKLLFIIHLQKH
ncbi:hypothetical protein FDB72_00150 [Clostridium botulinum]|uniref:Membrane protein n=1 Tax=Clostridium botulinum (strain Hall / ATCC 3502 / NCTC 13319 / Type A) TaxID=441771 RepID=A5HYY5_CLOBH|nr:hypothetical protein DB732_02505 [Clostridium botulinum]NFK36432.1 hypothetical protein [Clostridium botulinum H04402 065]CAL81994.1 putative membrane protein [Clostridium botulinum A str. ATCC 3502]AWB29180.1 hypothetical protein DBN47_02510 [Clostridium botulinum]EGT5614271.1 hypothetical protein [Clostridium botulinum]